jgi:protein SCO1/2
MTRRASIIGAVALAAIAAVLVAWFLVLPRLRPHVFNAQVIQGVAAPSVSLEGPGGEPVALTDFEDKVVVVYFGYTFCPDVCPITLAKVARARDMLGDAGEDVQVVMITVDPERDTSEVLADYTTAFDPTFVGLTGDPADIDRIATTYGVYYKAEESTSSAGYLVDHTSTVMVVDRNGELKLLVSFDATDVELAEDLEYLVG